MYWCCYYKVCLTSVHRHTLVYRNDLNCYFTASYKVHLSIDLHLDIISHEPLSAALEGEVVKMVDNCYRCPTIKPLSSENI